MIPSLRFPLFRRLIQVFWLLVLLGLAAWGSWQFYRLTAPPTRVFLTPVRPYNLQSLQALSSLDSSINVLRMALIRRQPETVLLNINERIRQQAQRVSKLTTSVQASSVARQLPNYCLVFRRLIDQKASPRLLSLHISAFQSQVRHLQSQVSNKRP